mmetsp:Transcript_11177/g.16960  ORF Transcript_11177/g.16960 Transcript_11177/m.16960 type:complete len:107 (-) Transcript_11177:515-835(-)
MLRRRYLHNSIRRAEFYEEVQPYSESLFNEVLETAWKLFEGDQSAERWQKVSRLVQKCKVQVLWDYLRFKQYRVVRFRSNDEHPSWLMAVALLSGKPALTVKADIA